MLRRFAIVSLAIIFLGDSAHGDEASPEISVVWSAGEGGLAWHFVYGLTATPKGTVLAFCEGRIRKGDNDPHHILLKRSTDQGRTWGPEIVIERSVEEQSWANPTPVVDRDTGHVFLLYAFNDRNQRSQVWVRESHDDGLTWSAAKELTSLFKDDPLHRGFHLPGPGHGIQLKDGRLLVQVWHRHSIQATDRQYGVSTLFSDDHGKSWQAGGYVPGDQHGSNESRLVELADGSVLLNARRAPHPKDRAISISRDRGASWSTPKIVAVPKEFTTVDAGLVRWHTHDPRQPEVMAVSFPDHLDQRQDMTVAASLNDGQTWPVRRCIGEGRSTYSDLVSLPDGSLGVLFGRDDVAFARVSWNWLSGQ